MPCADYQPPTQEMIDDKVVPPAALCAILTALQGGVNVVLDSINWEEAGVTRHQFNSWWKRHQWADRKRREREQAEAQQRALREQALAKLTLEERKALDL